MEEHQKPVVVPWDFTNVAENALAHAVKISRMAGNEICLLHIVDKDIKPAAEGEKKVLLQHVADENGKKYSMQINTAIVKGSIFTAIADFVNEKDASVVVMSTSMLVK